MNAEMTFADFMAKYKPIPNLIMNPNGHSYMYETYGEELEEVKKHSPYNVWTLVDAEDELFINPGWHLVNRQGYFITEVPWSESSESEEYYVYG